MESSTNEHTNTLTMESSTNEHFKKPANGKICGEDAIPRRENGKPRLLKDYLAEMKDRITVLEQRLDTLESASVQPCEVKNEQSADKSMLNAVVAAFEAGGILGVSRDYIRHWLETQGITDRPASRRRLNKLLRGMLQNGQIRRSGSLMKLQVEASEILGEGEPKQAESVEPIAVLPTFMPFSPIAITEEEEEQAKDAM